MHPSERSPGIIARIRRSVGFSRDFAILLSALVVVALGFGFLGPLMPAFRERLGISDSELGMMFSLFSFAFVFALPPAGYLADRLGRKRTIMAGIVLFGCTTLALVMVTEPIQFMVLRVLEGVGAALVTPAAFALTLDLVPEDKRGVAMGAEGTAQLLGAMAGPTLGGLVAGQLDFTYPFYIAAALAFACAAIIWFIKEPSLRAPSEDSKSILTMFGAWKRNARADRRLPALTMRGFVMGIVQGLWNLGLLMFWADDIDMTLTQTGIAMSIGMLTMAIGTVPFGSLSDKYGRKPFIIIGGALMAAGLAMMVLASQAWHVYILVAVSDFGAAMSNPSVGAMLGDVMKKEERGRVMGAYQTVMGVGNIVGFSALGLMYDYVNHQAPILVCAAALAVATSIIGLYVKETRKARDPGKGAVEAASGA